MVDLLIKTLEPLGYKIIRQGSLGKDEEYPNTFFTFWNNSTNDSSHYDNKASKYIWDFDLNIYSNEPEKIDDLLIKAKRELTKANFIVNGKGYDVASDEPTHIGRGINVKIIENGGV